MKYNIFLPAIAGIFLFASCGKNENQPQPGPVEKKDSVIKEQTSKKVEATDKIEGDFDGDGIKEFGFARLSIPGKGNPLEGGIADVWEMVFNNTHLRKMPIGCCKPSLLNEGDLNGDKKDDISVFQEPVNGCTYTMKAYAFYDESWNEIVRPFLIPTGCKALNNSELQERIFMEGGKIFVRETDPNDAELRKIRKED